MIGIQIYTVRSLTETAEGADKAISALKEIGYESIQLAGSIEVMKNAAAAAKKCGIRVIGILTGTANMTEHFDEVIAIAKDCGAEDIGISGSAKCEAEARELVALSNEIAKKVRAEGFSFSYHNHSHEFIRTECGKTVMDILLEGFDKELIDLMPDTYWLQHGGADVRDFIETHKERIKILHLKDMKRTPDGVTFAEIGIGNLNMRGILKTARECGISTFIVEQDICDGNPLDSAKISYDSLKTL